MSRSVSPSVRPPVYLSNVDNGVQRLSSGPSPGQLTSTGFASPQTPGYPQVSLSPGSPRINQRCVMPTINGVHRAEAQTLPSSYVYFQPSPPTPVHLPQPFIGNGYNYSQEIAMLRQEFMTRLQQEQQARSKLQAKCDFLEKELSYVKSHLTELDFFSGGNELQQKLHEIERRGNLQVDFETGEVKLHHQIKFVPRTTKDKPTAEVTQPEIADAVCRDLGELSQLFSCKVSIEGHTKGGESSFWQDLADARAQFVMRKMVESGADENAIIAIGKPGKLGLNQTTTLVKLNLTPEGLKDLRRGSKDTVANVNTSAGA